MATNDKPDELYPERKDIEVSELAPAMDQDELQLVTYFTGDARWTGGTLLTRRSPPYCARRLSFLAIYAGTTLGTLI